MEQHSLINEHTNLHLISLIAELVLRTNCHLPLCSHSVQVQNAKLEYPYCMSHQPKFKMPPSNVLLLISAPIPISIPILRLIPVL